MKAGRESTKEETDKQKTEKKKKKKKKKREEWIRNVVMVESHFMCDMP